MSNSVERESAAEAVETPAGDGRDSTAGAADESPQIAGELPSEPESVSTELEAPAEAVSANLAPQHTPALSSEIAELLRIALDTQSRLVRIEATVETAAKQVGFLPPQVRMLGGKIDGLSTSISEPRYRSILLSLLSVYDLADQVLRALPAPGNDGSAEDHRRNYTVLRAQLRQVLEANGLAEIPCEGSFNPEVHRALQSIAVDDPAKADQVLDVVRAGFRTDQSILRYAEVVVSRYEPPAPAPDNEIMPGLGDVRSD